MAFSALCEFSKNRSTWVCHWAVGIKAKELQGQSVLQNEVLIQSASWLACLACKVILSDNVLI